jgi:RecB family endonuclease NucS
MRLVIATCSVDYRGRLDAHLPEAVRLLMVKADGSVSIHADDRAYKPLNWMSPPCTLTEQADLWTVTNPKGETLEIRISEILTDVSHELGVDPGLIKDGVEAHLQELLAANPHEIAPGLSLIRREHPTDIGPVDLLCSHPDGGTVVVEVKRHADIDGVEQLSRYLNRLEADPRLRPLRGILVGQTIKAQARTLAEAWGITCVVVDYDRLRGMERGEQRLF